MPALNVVFDVTAEETGGYCAQAKLGSHSLFTEGDTLGELEAMIRDVLRLYSEELPANRSLVFEMVIRSQQ